MEQDNVLCRLVPRLKKIGINIEMVGYYCGNHGFTIAFLPIKPDQKMQLTDIREVFKIIRKYKQVS
jgi:hypothetical protein